MQARPNRISIQSARVARLGCSRGERVRAIRPAFTLVEMLVSVALIAVLMLAVTQIFSIASRTMSGGQAIGAAVRDAQAAQSVMARDFAAAANDGGCFIIRSVRQAAFRSAADYATAIDNTDPLKDDTDADGAVNVNYSGPGTTYSPLTYNFRNHRLDYVMFFARDRYRRQTGNSFGLTTPYPLVDDSSSSEAAIYYHHLDLPYAANNYLLGNDATPAIGLTGPGRDYRIAKSDPTQDPVAANPNNFFGTRWILGRVAMLLARPPVYNPATNYTAGDLVTSAGNVFKASTNSINQTPVAGATAYWVQVAVVSQTTTAFSPLSFKSTATGGSYSLQNSRYDLAYTSISDFKNIIQNNAPLWAVATAYTSGSVVTYQGNNYVCLANNSGHIPGDVTDPGYWSGWWNYLMTGGANNDQRFQASTLITGAITGDSSSKQVPIFLPACTQYIVEYAGDFVSQVPSSPATFDPGKTYAAGDYVEYNGHIYAALTASLAQNRPTYPTKSNASWILRDAGALDTSKANSGFTPDGSIDFVKGTNQIRWYGLPRDTNGDGAIFGNTGDVVTLRDAAYGMWTDWRIESIALSLGDPGKQPGTLPFTGWPQYSFEKSVPTAAINLTATTPINYSGIDYYAATLNANPEYLTAWGPSDTSRPKLVRITIVVDRPEAASNQFDGSSFEYVFKVGQ